MKRWFMFLGVNILIMATISIVTSVLGLNHYVTKAGLNYGTLMGFCLVWGMGGAFISLLLSKVMAKWMMGVEIQDPNGPYRDLVRKVHRHAQNAGLTTMPEVGIYVSDDLNAFATGPSKSNSLVAVSTGLLNTMSEKELDGVLAHEIAHIANGDMVTMTLLQGVLNAFVMFLAKVITFAISNATKKDDEDRGLGPIASVFVEIALQIVLSILASIVVNWFSRYREFKADAGGARLAGRDSMIAALEALQRRYEYLEPSENSVATMQISSKSRFGAMFASHPALADRIAALKNSNLNT